MMRRKKEIIAYYGAFLTDRVKAMRALPVLNHAASKRILRIAQGLDARDRKCVIISSGMAPRIVTSWKPLRPISERVQGVVALTVGQIGICFVGYLLTPIMAVLAAIQLNRHRRIPIVVQYNYYPDALIFSLWCKIFFRSKIILDLEDVAIPRFSDWKRGSEARPIQEMWSWVFMKVSVALADLVFAPSRKLGMAVHARKFMVVSGCQRIDNVVDDSCSGSGRESIKILMSGGIKFENGLQTLVDALRIADGERLKAKLSVVVCGPGKYDWLKDRVKDLKQIDVQMLGFLSNAEFEEVYGQIDVCLALQDPNGRYNQYKAPSKGYEALCSGKALIVGDIGDFDLLPDDVCFHLRPYSAKQLAEILTGLTHESVDRMRKMSIAYAKQNFDQCVVGPRILRTLCEMGS